MPENSSIHTENTELVGKNTEETRQSTENAVGLRQEDSPPAQDKIEDTSLAQEAVEEGFISKCITHPKTPWVFVLLVATALGYWLNTKYHFSSFLPGSTPRVVVFDPVKFMNAQRAAASILALRPNGDTAFAITQVAKQAENVILEEAQGAIVLVKQAVVVPSSAQDITDRVLKRFDLPTDVPTINMGTADSLMDIAPTDYSFSREEASDKYKEELMRRRTSIAEKMSSESAQAGAIP